MPDLIDTWPLPHAPELGRRLLDAYDEPHRTYHDVRHLAEVLDRLDRLLPRADGDLDRDTVVLAAWFHDAVYATGPDATADNEERSAALAEAELPEAGVPAGVVAEVARLVRLTASHAPAPDDLAGAVLCEADLGILATDRERYDEYAAAVREEYRHVAEDDFRRGRAAVLHGLLAHAPMFRVAPRDWEEAARANIAVELRRLEA